MYQVDAGVIFSVRLGLINHSSHRAASQFQLLTSVLNSG
jgi:hypothetical protein